MDQTQRKKECIVTLIALALVDFLASVLMEIALTGDGAILIPIIVGFFCGQAGAIMVWAVCGPLPSYLRSPVGVLLSSCFVALVGAPIFLNLYRMSGLRDAGFFLPIPLFVLINLAILWWAKSFFGWRFQHEQQQRRFSIIDLVAAITTLAFCLAVVRVGLTYSPSLKAQYVPVVFIVFVAWTMLLVLPIVKAAFFLDAEKRERFLLSFGLLVQIIIVAYPMVVAANAAQALPAVVILSFSHGALMLTLYLVLRFLRNQEILVPIEKPVEE